MSTSPSATVGSGFFRILTVLRPPKPVRTTARISFGGGVSFSFSSVAFSGVSSGGVSVVPFSVGVFSGAAAAGVSVLSVMSACVDQAVGRAGAGRMRRKPAGEMTRRETNEWREGLSRAGRRAGVGVARGEGANRWPRARPCARTPAPRADPRSISHYTKPGLTLLLHARHKTYTPADLIARKSAQNLSTTR